MRRFINNLLYNPLMVHFLKQAIAALLLFALLPVAALADEVSRACSLHWEEGAVEKCTNAAEQGNIEAQYQMGTLYQYGGLDDKPPRDMEKAVKWLRLAAEQGHIDAQSALGRMYFLGVDVTKDTQEGYVWLLMAGNQDSEGRDMELIALEKMLLFSVKMQLSSEQIEAAEAEAARRAAAYE